jgi:FAD/FMN-containing dehydrogenase
MRLKSWGRLTEYSIDARALDSKGSTASQLKARPALAHGASRSYGDVAIAASIWLTTNLDRFVEFDESTGQLTVEAGVQLGDIQKLFAPRGWLLPVSPGTQFVTVGGAIANDIHGKNHHSAGTFGEHITALTLVRTDGSERTCSTKDNRELFEATIGGLGLTGLITQASILLKKVPGPWIDAETIPFKNIDEFFRLSAESEAFEYSVAWFDCVSKSGHGIFTRGNHSKETKSLKPGRRITFPFTPPFSLINRVTLGLLNTAYFAMGVITKGKKTVSYEKFFYPLDGIRHWNRAYGPKGFFQHQCVLPGANAQPALQELLAAIRKAKAGSLLAVLKTTGERELPGLLSFGMKGVTLALDFPNQGAKTLKLLAKLEDIVVKHGGRLNPAKDATMKPETFRTGYPKLGRFLKQKDQGITSLFFERVIERKP